jgi:hypothetical protein
MTYAKQKSNKILLQRKKHNKVMTRNVSKTSVEQTKDNGEFYLYLVQKSFLNFF